jgi:ribonucleoside-diphosphate reductase alpha chain
MSDGWQGRRGLPDTRRSINHHATVASAQGDFSLFLTAGLFEDGTPAELFIRVSKAGSPLAALMDSIGILTSFGLQAGIPLATFCRKMTGMRFEPNGSTSNPEIPDCTSIVDYVFRWLERQFPAEKGA